MYLISKIGVSSKEIKIPFKYMQKANRYYSFMEYFVKDIRLDMEKK